MSQQEKPVPYEKSTLALVSSTFMAGMQQFDGNPYQSALAQVFCFAVREMILNELEGQTLPTAEVLGDVVERLHASTPTEAREAFSRLLPVDFDGWYKHIRIVAAKEGVDLVEFAEALRSARDITRSAL